MKKAQTKAKENQQQKIVPPSSSHCHFLESYISGDLLCDVLSKHKADIRRFAYIWHDKDTYDDDTEIHSVGDLKTPHWHILLDLWNSRRSDEVRDWFYDLLHQQNTLNQIALSKVKCYQYLTHENYPEKHQYSALEIVSNDRLYFERLCSKRDADDSLQEALDDMLNGCSTSYCASKYGRDYIINYKNVKCIAEDIAREEQQQLYCQYLYEQIQFLSKQVTEGQAEVTNLKKQINTLRKSLICESVKL